MTGTELHRGHWILLRGLARHSGHWGAFADQLQQAMGAASVTLLDIAGNGSRRHEASPLSIEAMARDCRWLWQQHHAAARPGPVMVLGLSMGGMVAVEWARQASQEVAGLVLINSSMRPLGWPWQRLRPTSYARLARMFISMQEADRWESGIFSLTAHRADPRIIRHWERLHAAFPPQRLQVLRQLLAAARYRLPPAKTWPPALVLASERDQLVHPHCSQALASVLGAGLALHATAGHDLPLDDGPWVAACIAAWARERRSGRSHVGPTPLCLG